MRVVLKNQRTGEKKTFNAFLAEDRWLEIRPNGSTNLCADLTKEQVAEFHKGNEVVWGSNTVRKVT